MTLRNRLSATNPANLPVGPLQIEVEPATAIRPLSCSTSGLRAPRRALAMGERRTLRKEHRRSLHNREDQVVTR